MSRTNGSISGVSWTMFLLGLASSADTGPKPFKKAKSPRPAIVPAVKARPTKSRRDNVDDMAGLLPGRGWKQGHPDGRPYKPLYSTGTDDWLNLNGSLLRRGNDS